MPAEGEQQNADANCILMGEDRVTLTQAFAMGHNHRANMR
jgi:hypothetical protein